ncbi:hypothetical protein HPULCUR_004065 [Helicostylum pulchrum]|uniref:Uncharacterized protein n=1 Tax=Helicostylum pulchrum TaxID=562976 RepID=A0ABP9XV46_9FUNG
MIMVAESSALLKSIEKSHDENKMIAGKAKLETYLEESVDVKLPWGYLSDVDDIKLSSSPFRPSSECSHDEDLGDTLV